ncbi:hypothetical protein PG985_001519 [Apiospora marii]|uniref:uncharacterized protein n=1 Tax=Apiospora marii TaxID=335849 RepID=UPI00312D29E9
MEGSHFAVPPTVLITYFFPPQTHLGIRHRHPPAPSAIVAAKMNAIPSPLSLRRVTRALVACIGFMFCVLLVTIKLKIEHVPAKGCALFPFSVDNTFRNYGCYVHHTLWIAHPYMYIFTAISLLLQGFIPLTREFEMYVIYGMTMSLALNAFAFLWMRSFHYERRGTIDNMTKNIVAGGLLAPVVLFLFIASLYGLGSLVRFVHHKATSRKTATKMDRPKEGLQSKPARIKRRWSWSGSWAVGWSEGSDDDNEDGPNA